jgi:hypothetical protein
VTEAEAGTRSCNVLVAKLREVSLAQLSTTSKS